MKKINCNKKKINTSSTYVNDGIKEIKIEHITVSKLNFVVIFYLTYNCKLSFKKKICITFQILNTNVHTAICIEEEKDLKNSLLKFILTVLVEYRLKL